ncbi:MAG: hypothetical protein LBQ18_08275 [Campylobacteraceae bacterium]|jgi:small nuclear ribonucleoprotein (snRNP)-like protein|nr:hypothetical protein [Campylobacteraceae bacterium]
MKNVILVIAALFLLSGCVSKHDVALVGFNTDGVLKGVFDEENQTVTVTMSDGEVLKGKYSSFDDEGTVIFDNAIGYSTGGRHYGRGTFGGISMGINLNSENKKYALLTSETSSLKMEITIVFRSWSRNGMGEAKTNDGRVYKIQF